MTESLASHPTPEQIDGLVVGALEASTRRWVVRHLLTGCERCRRLAATSWPYGLAPESAHSGNAGDLTSDRSLDATLTRVLHEVEERRIRVAENRRQAPGLFSEINRLPFEQCRLLLANGRKFHTWAFAYYVSERAEDAGFDDAARAIELAELAIVVAERIEASSLGECSARDLLAHCWATLGNARRIGGNLDLAEEALLISEEWLKDGSGDPSEGARQLRLMALLRREQRRFEEALRLQSRAASIYRSIGESHMQGRTLVSQAKTFDDMQEPARSVATLRKAVSLIDPEREPRVLLAAYHNLIHSLGEMGRGEEAKLLLRRARPLYVKVGGALNLIRLRWLEGKIERQNGHHLAACGALLEARDAFLSRGMGYEAALVTLDLALTHLETGNHFEVAKLAAEAIPIFKGLGIQREAFAALLALGEAAQQEVLSAALLRELYTRASRTPSVSR